MDMDVLVLFNALVKQLCDEEDKAFVEALHLDEKNITYQINVAKGDMPKVIGIQGRNIKAIQTIFNAISTKHRRKSTIIVKEP